MSSFDSWYIGDATLKVEPDEELVKLFYEKGEGEVLDIGCGRGRNSLYLASLGYNVIAVDVSKYAIIQLNQNAKLLGYDIEGIVCDISDFSFSEKYDIIVITNVLQFILKRIEQINIIYKVMEYLSTNGIIFIKHPLTVLDLESQCFRNGMLNRFFTHSGYIWEILLDINKLAGPKKDFEYNIFIAKKS
ncbi:MAG: methyltransferase domain-containing protein [Candidatus Heimdallarchaeaceae archaeon]